MNNQTKNNRILSKILPVFLLVSISLSSWSINGIDSISKAIDKLTNILIVKQLFFCLAITHKV